MPGNEQTLSQDGTKVGIFRPSPNNRLLLSCSSHLAPRTSCFSSSHQNVSPRKSRISSGQAPRAAGASLPGTSPTNFSPSTKLHHIPHTACLASGTADPALTSNSGVSCGVSSPPLQLSTAPTGNMPEVGTYALSTVSQASFNSMPVVEGVSLSRLPSISSHSRHWPRVK